MRVCAMLVICYAFKCLTMGEQRVPRFRYFAAQSKLLIQLILISDLCAVHVIICAARFKQITHGMRNCKIMCMQAYFAHHTPGILIPHIEFPPVFYVSNDWVAYIRQLSSDLMLSACVEIYSKQSKLMPIAIEYWAVV
mmetsp:Transcript_16813/g.31863  ORF Transcript_16813/g.31863 Transcript_16813/m.31863 type:complete len:138 (-) Transcript_16813:546-959(-)